MFFEPNKFGDAIFFRKTRCASFTVSKYAGRKVSRYPGIQCAIALIGENIDEAFRHRAESSGWPPRRAAMVNKRRPSPLRELQQKPVAVVGGRRARVLRIGEDFALLGQLESRLGDLGDGVI